MTPDTTRICGTCNDPMRRGSVDGGPSEWFCLSCARGGASEPVSAPPARSAGMRPVAAEAAVKQAKVERSEAQSFTLPWPPLSNNFKTARIRFKDGKPMPFMALSKAAIQYKSDTSKILLAARPTIMTGPLRITMRLYRPRKIGDWDGAVKLPIDSLIGHAMEDDSQIVEAHVYRGDSKTDPRVEITLEAV